MDRGRDFDAHTSTLDGVEAWVWLTRDATHPRNSYDQAEEEDDCVHPIEKSARENGSRGIRCLYLAFYEKERDV